MYQAELYRDRDAPRDDDDLDGDAGDGGPPAVRVTSLDQLRAIEDAARARVASAGPAATTA